ncbi:MAG: L,D-transpeptidase [Deltaproteobacteria bacterium]|nr:L,D-transpeptidase [Deltaproteobacteria bacterium]
MRALLVILLAQGGVACSGVVDARGGDGGSQAKGPAAPAAPPEVPDVRETAAPIAHGIVTTTSVNVAPRPASESLLGMLRWGARFEVYERSGPSGGCRDPWLRIGHEEWLCSTGVTAREGREPQPGFIPPQPRLESDLPYRYMRVTADELPVYRRPPRVGEEPSTVQERVLKKGYVLTIDKFVNIYQRELYRTPYYKFVPRDGTHVVTGPAFRGVEVRSMSELPLGWITDPTAKAYEAPSMDAPNEPIERHTRAKILEKKRGRGEQWYQLDLGAGRPPVWIGSLQLAYLDRVPRPRGVGARDRWVHVSLRNQTVAMYEGDRMIFATLGSSGDDEHPTPAGLYRIESKRISATMDNEDNLAGPYLIQDVPWVMYFHASYALHGAFWHDRFGLRTSHGCINLAPNDARRMFGWIRPELIAGWHAIFSRPGRSGSVVEISE